MNEPRASIRTRPWGGGGGGTQGCCFFFNRSVASLEGRTSPEKADGGGGGGTPSLFLRQFPRHGVGVASYYNKQASQKKKSWGDI